MKTDKRLLIKTPARKAVRMTLEINYKLVEKHGDEIDPKLLRKEYDICIKQLNDFYDLLAKVQESK